MPRVKRGTQHVKRRKNILEKVKGYRWSRKNTIRAAQTAINKAGQHGLRDRRAKKRVNRALWQVRINAACRANGTTYSKFIAALAKNNVELDRKVLSQLAAKNPDAFAAVVSQVSK